MNQILTEQLRTGFNNFFQNIKEVKCFNINNDVEKYMIDLLMNIFKNQKLQNDYGYISNGFKFLNAKEFKEYYRPYYNAFFIDKKTRNTDFRNINVNMADNDFLIIHQPHGSQTAPDILIIANKIGLMIEIKTNKNDSILWNEGFGRLLDCIYVFGLKNKKIDSFTYFLGSSQICNDLKQLLEEQTIEVEALERKALQKLNENNYNILGYNLREQFTTKNYFKYKTLKGFLEEEVSIFINNIEW